MSKPTPKQEKQVTDWFMDKFWPNYPAKFCGRGKGSRAISCKLMVAYNPDESERERILGNLKAQVRAHQQKPEEQRSFWKIGETYVRNHLWDDEIESAMEVKTRQELKTCKMEGCRQDVHGPSFDVCSEHVPNAHREHMKQAWIRTGIQKNSPDFVEQCRQQCRERMNLLMGKSNE
jgi:hypothetical protein